MVQQVSENQINSGTLDGEFVCSAVQFWTPTLSFRWLHKELSATQTSIKLQQEFVSSFGTEWRTIPTVTVKEDGTVRYLLNEETYSK